MKKISQQPKWCLAALACEHIIGMIWLSVSKANWVTFLLGLVSVVLSTVFLILQEDCEDCLAIIRNFPNVRWTGVLEVDYLKQHVLFGKLCCIWLVASSVLLVMGAVGL